MTTFAIVFNSICILWCVGVVIFYLVKRNLSRKKAKEDLEKDENK